MKRVKPPCTCQPVDGRNVLFNCKCPRHGDNGTRCKDHTRRDMKAERFDVPGGSFGTNEYSADLDWMKRMSKTHRQIRCGECGLFRIWVPFNDPRR